MTHRWIRALALSACLSLLPSTASRAASEPPRAAGIHYLYLVRHGMYDRDDKADDRVGNPLNALGHAQAKLLGARLAGLPVRMHSIVSSDFTRARDTGDDIAGALGMTCGRDTLLHECTPTFDLTPEYRMNHSETDVALCDANLAAAWQKYFVPTPDEDTRDVLVCHGNVIRWLTCRALGVDLHSWQHLEIANASLTVIAVRPDGSTRLVEFSDTGHLPVDEQTWTGKGAGWTAPPK